MDTKKEFSLEPLVSDKKTATPTWSQKTETSEKTKFQGRHIYSRKAIIFIALLFLLLALVLLVLFSIYLSSKLQIHQGLWSFFNLDNICPKLPPGFSCQGSNPLTPYSRALWPHLGDKISGFQGSENTTEFMAHLVGAHFMSLQDAIIVYGLVPVGYLYWAITLYLYDIPSAAKKSVDGRLGLWASVGDSISSPRVLPGSAPYLITVFSANPGMVKIALEKFLKSWDSVKKPFQIHQVLIPQAMYNPTFRYFILGRATIEEGKNQVVPSFGCQWYTDPLATIESSPVGIPLIPRGKEPNETIDILSPSEWRAWCRAYVISLNYTIVQDNPTMSPLPQGYPNIPTGIDYGLQCLTTLTQCNGDNRDTIYYSCFNLPVTRQNAIVVVSLNHVATLKCKLYCNLAFSDQRTLQGYESVTTGDINTPTNTSPPFPWENSVRLTENIPPDKVFDEKGEALLYVTERTYVSPTTVGPTYGSTLPPNAFVVLKPPYVGEAEQKQSGASVDIGTGGSTSLETTIEPISSINSSLANQVPGTTEPEPSTSTSFDTSSSSFPTTVPATGDLPFIYYQ